MSEPRSFWLRYFHPRIGQLNVTVVVEDGVVSDVKQGFFRIPGLKLFDLSKWIALPGVIDMHVHLRGLELAYKEDEMSGTRAAAHGGVTAVVDMPNTVPRLDSVEALSRKLVDLYAKSWVDYGVFVAVPRDGNHRGLLAMLSMPGVAGVKVYPEDYAVLQSLAHRIPPKTLIVAHAEHPALLREGCGFGERWRCRPIEAEIEAINFLDMVTRQAQDLRIHVTHVTNSLVAVYAKRRGFTTDTCPHYLRLTCLDEAKLRCLATVNPPLRPPEIATDLLSHLNEIDALSSDHAPHAANEKSDDICMPGISSLDFYTPLITDLVKRGLLELEDVVRLTNLGPQRILGLEGWGCIERGCLASFTVVDLSATVRIDSSFMESKCKVSPYMGSELWGRVVATIVRGFVTYLEGELYERCNAKPLPFKRRGWARHG